MEKRSTRWWEVVRQVHGNMTRNMVGVQWSNPSAPWCSFHTVTVRELAIRSLLSTHLRCLRSTQTEHITRLHGTLVIVQHKLLNFIVLTEKGCIDNIDLIHTLTWSNYYCIWNVYTLTPDKNGDGRRPFVQITWRPRSCVNCYKTIALRTYRRPTEFFHHYEDVWRWMSLAQLTYACSALLNVFLLIIAITLSIRSLNIAGGFTG